LLSDRCVRVCNRWHVAVGTSFGIPREAAQWMGCREQQCREDEGAYGLGELVVGDSDRGVPDLHSGIEDEYQAQWSPRACGHEPDQCAEQHQAPGREVRRVRPRGGAVSTGYQAARIQ